MKNIRNTSSNKTASVALLVSLPLLILGGCAGNDTKSFTGDMSLVETEIKQEMSESEFSHASELNGEMNNLPVDMANQEDQSYQSPQEGSVSIEIDEVTESTDVAEMIANEELLTEPQELIIGFGFDESDIDMQYTELLSQHAEYLKENENLVLSIGGHTDISGDRAYNEFLSKKRANAVANVLIELGVAEEQIKVSGKASDEPLTGAISHREHRRVELNYQDQQIVSN